MPVFNDRRYVRQKRHKEIQKPSSSQEVQLRIQPVIFTKAQRKWYCFTLIRKQNNQVICIFINNIVSGHRLSWRASSVFIKHRDLVVARCNFKRWSPDNCRVQELSKILKTPHIFVTLVRWNRTKSRQKNPVDFKGSRKSRVIIESRNLVSSLFRASWNLPLIYFL